MKNRLSSAVSALAIVSLLTAGSALADNQQRNKEMVGDWQKGPPSVETKLARISYALDLSDEQSAQMLTILQEQERQRAALHEQTMALLGPEICAERAETEAAILSILDAEQAALYDELRQNRQERGDKGNRKGKRNGALDCADFEG